MMFRLPGLWLQKFLCVLTSPPNSASSEHYLRCCVLDLKSEECPPNRYREGGGRGGSGWGTRGGFMLMYGKTNTIL